MPVLSYTDLKTNWVDGDDAGDSSLGSSQVGPHTKHHNDLASAVNEIKAKLDPPYFGLNVTGLLAAGHSVIEGGNDTGGSQVANRMSSRLALLLGCDENNIGKGSMPLFADNSTNSTSGIPAAITWGTTGGWVSLFQAMIWPSMARTDTPPMSPLQVALFMQSLADMSVAGRLYFEQFHAPMLRAAINVMRCGSVFEENDASVVHSGGSSSAAANYSRSGSLRAFAATGTTTISVPSRYPGSLPIDVGGVYVNGAKNVKVQVTVNGVRRATYDLDIHALPTPPAGNNPEWSPWQIRIPASEFNVGANTIVLEYAASGGSFDAAFFDYWQIEAVQPPVILLPEHYYWEPGAYTNFYGTSTPITDADVDTANALVESIAAEYTDGLVVYVPGINAAINPPGEAARLQADGVHPNAHGAGAAAAVLHSALLNKLTPEALATSGTV